MSEDKKIGLRVEAAGVHTSYANAFQARFAEGEIILTCGVSHMEPSADEAFAGTLVVDMQDRLAMTPQSAGRLMATLSRTLQEYEERYGKVESGEKK